MARRELTTEEIRAQQRLKTAWDTKKKSLGLTQESAAEQMGWSGQASVYQYLSGKIPLNMDATVKFCNVLNESPFDIYPEAFMGLENVLELQRPSEKTAPLIDLIQAGVWSDVNDPYEMGDGADHIPIDTNSDVDFFFEVSGYSMSPEFMPGDKVGVKACSEASPGDYVVAKLELQEQATFKKYRDRGVDAEGNRIFDLIPLNDDFPTYRIDQNLPGRIVGVVIEHRKYLSVKHAR